MLAVRIAVLIAATLPVAAAAAWTTAATDNLAGYTRGSSTVLTTKLRELQDFDALLRVVTQAAPAPSAAKLPIYFVKGSEFRHFGVTNPNIDGFYTSGPGLTAAFIAFDRGRGGDGTTLFHEYAHHFMFASGRSAYPAWYVEGLAEYLSTARLERGVATVGDASRGRAVTLVRGIWLPLAKVLTTRPADLKRDEIGQFYAQSWLLVHYLTRDDTRRTQLKAYLAALNRGVGTEAAFASAFGTDPPAMEKALRTYMTSRALTLTRFNFAGAETNSLTPPAALPDSADMLLVPSLRLARRSFARTAPDADGVAPDDAALLAEVRAGAAAFTGDAFADAVRIEAELKLGDRAAGVAALDAAIAAHRDDAQLLYMRGMTLIADGIAAARAGGEPVETMRRARVALTAANRLRPDDYRILAAHARTYRLSAMPAKEIDVVLRASDLAPQVASVATFAARAVLAVRGDKALAKALLEPVAANPHGGAAAAQAAAMIASIDRDTPLGPVDTAEQ